MYDFGVHYANGDGVTQDFTKDRYWIHQAALKEYSLAQYNLEVMFFDGIGGIKSQECAIHWLNKATLDSSNIGLMAKQALAAMVYYHSALEFSIPKVYRILTVKECEKLPKIDFPAEHINAPNYCN